MSYDDFKTKFDKDKLQGMLDKDKLKGVLTQENLMNKGTIIAILAALLIFGSIWGSVVNKKRIAQKEELKAIKSSEQVHAQAGQKHEKAVAGQHAKLEKKQQKVATKQPEKVAAVPAKGNDVQKTRHELEDLRKAKAQLQADLSNAKAAAQKMQQKNTALSRSLKKSNVEIAALQAQLSGKPAPQKGDQALSAPTTSASPILPIDKIQELLATQQKMIKELRQKEQALKKHLVKREKNIDELSKVLKAGSIQPAVKAIPAGKSAQAAGEAAKEKKRDAVTVKASAKEMPVKKDVKAPVAEKAPAKAHKTQKESEQKHAPSRDKTKAPAAEKHDDTHKKEGHKEPVAAGKH